MNPSTSWNAELTVIIVWQPASAKVNRIWSWSTPIPLPTYPRAGKPILKSAEHVEIVHTRWITVTEFSSSPTFWRGQRGWLTIGKCIQGLLLKTNFFAGRCGNWKHNWNEFECGTLSCEGVLIEKQGGGYERQRLKRWNVFTFWNGSALSNQCSF